MVNIKNMKLNIKNKRQVVFIISLILLMAVATFWLVRPSFAEGWYIINNGLLTYNYNGVDFYMVGNLSAVDVSASTMQGDVGWYQEDVGLGKDGIITRMAASTFPNPTSAPGQYLIIRVYFPGTPQDIKFVIGNPSYDGSTYQPDRGVVHSNVFVNNQIVGEFIPVKVSNNKYDGPINTIPASYFQQGYNEIKFVITQVADVPENRAYRLVFIGPVGAYEPWGLVARNLSASQTGVGQVTLNWDPVAYSNYVVNYKVYVNGTEFGTTSDTSIIINNLSPGNYEISVAAVLDGVEKPRSLPVNVTVLPAPISNLQVSNITKTSAMVSWTGTGADEYKVYLNGNLIGTTTGTQYDLTGLTPGTNYKVEVSPVQNGVEGQKTSATFSTLVPDPVTNLQVTNITTTSATATWTGTPSADYYKVYLNGSLAGTTTNTQYSFSGLTPGTSYTVSVSAVESGVESDKVSTTFQTPLPPTFRVYWIPGGSDVRVEWSSNGSSIPSGWLQLWRQDSQSGIWMPAKEISEAEKDAFTWTDINVTAGLNYKYQIRLYNPTTWEWDVIAESNWAELERPFSAPGGLKITSKSDTSATVTWNTVQGATTYQVQVSTDGGATWQTSTVSGPPVTVPRPCQVRVKAGTHARSQWSGILTVQ